ncbi:MAG: 30S ribosomal protein S11 [Candidatus Staskawiczbacteria bacterium]|jgi:small subunit ribosomal protein S11
MGKKHVIQKSQEEIIKETDKIEAGFKKEARITSAPQAGTDGKVFISSSYNNTMITLTDFTGKALAWKSAGSVGFKGAKKGTAFASSKVGEMIAGIIIKLGIRRIHVYVKGIGPGRDSAIRALMAQGLNIAAIKDVTPIPHNGCRARKVRRV